MCQALVKLFHSSQSREVAYDGPLLQTRKLRPKEMKEHGQAYELWSAEQEFECQRPRSLSSSRETVEVKGVQTSWAVWPCYRLWGNSNISILMCVLKSYPVAERPGRWQMLPLSRHRSRVINHIQGLGYFLCLGKEDGSAYFSLISWLGCHSELTGKCTVFSW